MNTPRPPVVAILGHIDHGKSSLIDYIRKTNIVEKEVGSITQHPSAYEITRSNGSRITFIDTPGHEAFTSIRTRCASVADTAVLIVSAEDGVKPQTIEVIKYIKECGLPYLVAITKVDKPTADINRAKQSLAENEVYVEGYGGNISVVEVSSVTGQGVDDLLDMVSLMAEMEAKTADPEALGSGVIIESRMDPKRGISAVGIIHDGTVRRSLFAATAGAIAPIRFLLDAEGNTVEELTFSSPVQIVGWNKIPSVGAKFKTFLKKDEALAFAASTSGIVEVPTQSKTGVGKEITVLPIVLKADTAGSLEAIIGEIYKLSREKIEPKIILSSVGNINENDVKSAQTTPGTIIIGFNIKVDLQAANLAERSDITITLFSVIYELTDKIKEFLTEKEPKTEVEEIESTSKVIRLFGTSKGKQVLGGLKCGAFIKIIRREAEIGHGKVKELQQFKIAIDSTNQGAEFGALVESKTEIAPGDILNAIVLVTK